MKQHECKRSRTCQCSITALEPNDACPVHASGGMASAMWGVWQVPEMGTSPRGTIRMTRFQQVWEEAKKQKEINRVEALVTARNLERRRERDIAEIGAPEQLRCAKKGKL